MIYLNIKNSFLIFLLTCVSTLSMMASSHREAPLISSDPLADNVDLYAFRSPDNPNTVTIIATYVPLQLPHGAPNYYSFGENIRYEIHVDNDATILGDEVTYRFTFTQVNEDPTTFFNIRLGKQNQKTTYTLEKSTDGGISFTTIITEGVVPPNNIGPRSIESSVGLGTTYDALYNAAITTANSGEKVFAGPTDDPFFADLGGIFDLGDAPRQSGTPVDGLACYNVSAIAIQVPIATLLKEGAVSEPTSILDADYVVGVWASASRQAITTLSMSDDPAYSGDWIQVSRLGMPLTNEAVIPVGQKDFWNSITPYDEIGETTLDEYFFNPELALYMDDDQFGGAVPGLAALRIQKQSLGGFNFSNGADGLFSLKGTDAVAGTALDDAIFGTLLLPAPGKPRSVDLWPTFHTGVPNVIPYQLATGKDGNPLAAGKPFVNNFLPNGGDMLRLNMAVPPTPRDDVNFSSLGLIQAAAIGLTVAPFNTSADLEFLPNMDGFPNGRRLEDDVTRIELQAVAGAVLAAVGLWYDDYDPATSSSPVTDQLLSVLSYTTGVENNDKPFGNTFPYLAMPHSGTGDCSGEIVEEEGNGEMEESISQFFVSSNNSGQVGVFDLGADRMFTMETFASQAMDADGVFYDKDNDVLYQLNRSDNVIQAYSSVNASLMAGNIPQVTATSTADFTNGREIAFSNGKIVVAQDANDGNGQTNKFYIYDANPTSITLEKVYDATINLWGIHLDDQVMYAIEDNSSNLVQYNDFFNLPAGTITPNATVSIEAMVRTHGITYIRDGDIMVLTDVGEASSAEDGAFTIINGWMQAAMDGNIDLSEQIRIEGPSTFLGNPVDIAYDGDQGMVYVAERANGGGRVLSYAIPTMSGDMAPNYNQEFAGASAIYLSCAYEGPRPAMNGEAMFFASSNTVRNVGVYMIDDSENITTNHFTNVTTDADGIYYDLDTDILYQLNRFNSSINAYDNVIEDLGSMINPSLYTTSNSAFSNGREIAFSKNRIVVAQDGNDGNDMMNKLVIYTVDGTSIRESKTYEVNINLWGIHVDGETLYAIVDNSNQLAVFNNFFNQPEGLVLPNRVIAVDGLVRTHGISYIRDMDMMLLTDVGAASSADDGAFIVVRNYLAASADGTISMAEQIRVEGGSTLLGNPVDIAFDRERMDIYIAERASGGGRILGFEMPSMSGDFAPTYNDLFPGASAIHFPSRLDIGDDQVLMTEAQLFASSNTQRAVAVYNILTDNLITATEWTNVTMDADGIHYDADRDRLYQVTRFGNAVNAYDMVNANLNAGRNPVYTTSSMANFSNGREMAVSGNRLVVAQDANDANGNQNALLIYDISGDEIVFLQRVDVDINLWGIHAEGETLYAIVDNSNQLAIYNDFFQNASSNLLPSSVIEIEGIIRTHGITYDAASDQMFLTDVGDAASGEDGAFTVIPNFSTISGNQTIGLDQQIRIEGLSTLLGNPVDIAYDAARTTIYIAERKRDGGRILGFALPEDSGEVEPVYNDWFGGASAVYLSPVNGGAGSFLRNDAEELTSAGTILTSIDQLHSEQKENVNFTISSFPNPAKDFINIMIDGIDNTNSVIEIYSVNGVLISKMKAQGITTSINISTYNHGAYLLRVTNGSVQKYSKFIKTK